MFLFFSNVHTEWRILILFWYVLLTSVSIKPVLLVLECVYESPGDVVKKRQNSVGLRLCISDTFPGDLSAAGP